MYLTYFSLKYIQWSQFVSYEKDLLLLFFNPILENPFLNNHTNKDDGRCAAGKVFPELENHDNQHPQEREMLA